MLLAAGLFVLAVALWTLQESAYDLTSRLPGWAVLLVVAGYTLPLAVRRRYPEPVLAVVAAAQIVSVHWQVVEVNVVLVTLFVAFYTVGAWSPNRRRALVVRVLVVAAQAIWTVGYFVSTLDQMYENRLDRGVGPESSWWPVRCSC